MARHADFTITTGMPIYFLLLRPPLARATRQQRNTNGLLRQYFPTGTDLSVHSQADFDGVAAELNDRPRKTLNWRKPSEALNDLMVNAMSA
jgi:transposase, IS30 family